MERFLLIAVSAAAGTLFYWWFSLAVRKKAMQDFILSHQWLLHPNAICYWRAAMALLGFVLYFYSPYQAIAIFIFTIAAILDGVDGVVARGCNLVSRWGEWLDPMCDKFTYLPALVGFAYRDILSVKLVWALVIIEFAGQFLARRILKMIRFSGAANNFGKIKAIICFALVILCALMDANPGIIDIADGVLMACLVLSTASIVFKFIPNRLYADILSFLNFTCGVTSLILTWNGFFVWAICIIIIGQLFDLFDGRMALKHGGTKYGPWMDDVADFVSFGIAPAFMIQQKGGTLSWPVGLLFVLAVAWRLLRFVLKDKHRTDLPYGVFNGLPSPAGALIVLGASLVAPPVLLWIMTVVAGGLMISHIRFAHFGRLIIKKVPKPVFFTISAAITFTLAYILKTRDVHMFGYLILAVAAIYMAVGRRLIARP